MQKYGTEKKQAEVQNLKDEEVQRKFVGFFMDCKCKGNAPCQCKKK